jgi:hypothetical protein
LREVIIAVKLLEQAGQALLHFASQNKVNPWKGRKGSFIHDRSLRSAKQNHRVWTKILHGPGHTNSQWIRAADRTEPVQVSVGTNGDLRKKLRKRVSMESARDIGILQIGSIRVDEMRDVSASLEHGSNAQNA